MDCLYVKFIVLLSITTSILSYDVSTICEVKGNRRVLDCSSKGLKSVPDFNRFCSSVRTISELYLTNNRIKVLDLNQLRCFKRLRKLHADYNNIHTIQSNNGDDTILNKLEMLSLDYNDFRMVPSDSLRKLKNLYILRMSKNRIHTIKNDTFLGMNRLRELVLFGKHAVQKDDIFGPVIHVEIGAFRYMKSLKTLDLDSYEVKIKHFPDLTGTNNLKEVKIINITNFDIPRTFCQDHKSLRKLYVGLSTMDEFPKLKNCSGLEELDFTDNTIHYIGKEAFSGLPHLKKIDFWRQRKYSTIHQDAFKHLPSLTFLELSEYPLGKFPNLEGTNNLEELKLDNSRITNIPDEFCSHMPKLEEFSATRNDIRTLPSLSKCKDLKVLNLMLNKLNSLTDQLKGLTKLEVLRLNHNNLREISKEVFGSTRHLESLELRHNLIHTIHQQAFVNITNLRFIDVSHNLLKRFPSAGLQSVSRIIANGNRDMIEFPTQQELPHAKRLTLDYHYHCCFFLKHVQQIHQRYLTRELSTHSEYKIVEEDDVDYPNFIHPNNLGHLTDPKNDSSTISESGDEVDPFFTLLQQLNNHTKIFIHKPNDDVQQTMKQFFEEEGDGYCTPTPNEFYPCEDLMGKEWLRGCVWIVFLLAIFGNTTVLIVLCTNFKKLDVPRFLVLNLAVADLFLGIYLGFLAFVDLKTLGDFRSHALDWQFSNSCRSAGFLAVFSSELSVFTLTLITLERFLTLKNAPHIDKRLTKKQCMIIMAFAWLFSMFLASLPLINGEINDYTKYSVCLPFETETLPSRIYLIFILVMNLLAFVVILFCYIHLYLIIRNSPARNTGDSRAARKMAILVFTDFFCWFPIALVALSTVFDNPFITDLWVSKVITILIFPLNACANPFLYAISMKQFRKDIMSATRQIRDKITHRHEIRKSLLKLPLKGSLTYSTSVRRESSCSFLFSRRHSSKPDNDSKYSRNTPIMQPSFQQSFEEPEEDDFQERLTTV